MLKATGGAGVAEGGDAHSTDPAASSPPKGCCPEPSDGGPGSPPAKPPLTCFQHTCGLHRPWGHGPSQSLLSPSHAPARRGQLCLHGQALSSPAGHESGFSPTPRRSGNARAPALRHRPARSWGTAGKGSCSPGLSTPLRAICGGAEGAGGQSSLPGSSSWLGSTEPASFPSTPQAHHGSVPNGDGGPSPQQSPQPLPEGLVLGG